MIVAAGGLSSLQIGGEVVRFFPTPLRAEVEQM